VRADPRPADVESTRPASPLEKLAVRRGVAVRYTDAAGAARHVGTETLLAVLRALGEDLNGPGQAAEALRGLEAASELLPPVIVAWDGVLEPRALSGLAGDRVAQAVVMLEDGTEAPGLITVAGQTAGLPTLRATGALPLGIHRLAVFPRSGRRSGGVGAGGGAPSDALGQAVVIAAPSKAPPLLRSSWGVFAPTYALSDRRDLAAGDLTCLEAAATLVGQLHGSYFLTLPLLADYSAIEAPGERPSPYSPLSRMWWNEAFLDPARVPELCEELHLLESGGRRGASEGAADRAGGRATGWADVAAAGARLRPLLAAGAARVERAGGSRLAQLRAFEATHPEVRRYAAFRAAAEAAGPDPARWPQSWGPNNLVGARDVAEEAIAAHVYAQFVTDEQIAAVARRAIDAGCRLVLDLPIGSRRAGYDTWAYPSSFAGSRRLGGGTSVTVGAPPDQFFSAGQDWDLPPLDPEGERRAGYPVVRAVLGHLLRHAGALRIDHAMGVRRLWWIPEGAAATEGAYVHYPSDELLALFCLEAWRHEAALVAEDLGTVEPVVHRLLAQHGIAGMEVAVFDLESAPGRRLEPRPGAVAFVDTHDTATFAGWFDATDIDDRVRLGFLGRDDAATERARRMEARDLLVARLESDGRLAPGDTHDPGAVHSAVLEELGESPAGVVIAGLEDLWSEHDPQNLPGTIDDHLNFARRFVHSIEDLAATPSLIEPLCRLGDARRGRADAAAVE
jgi:4-alpha-glucanotransferase